MPIQITDWPEPLSDKALSRRGPDFEPILVESSASRVLRLELQRYCEGMINGRSFLIAGHRGAGKTTLVAKAFMDVLQNAAHRSAVGMLRPLFVPLHGPSLFPSPEVRAAPAKPPAADGDAAGEGATVVKPEEKTEAQIALEQITLGLHRAVSREFARSYEARAADLAWLQRTPAQAMRELGEIRARRSLPPGLASEDDNLPDPADLARMLAALPDAGELFELAGQLEAELYECPPPHRLWQYWERMHALTGGVLFRDGFVPLHGAIPTPALPPGLFPNLVAVQAQGARELVALSGVIEAYRRISGNATRTDSEKATQQRTSEQISGWDQVAKQLAPPIVSLLTGGLAATGLGLAGAGTGLTALAGLATALGASLVFKATSTRKSDWSVTRDYQFVYDLSVSTLDRVLPILIERLRQAGLAPVFVVDELDKVGVLATRLVSMVHCLKKLVAENAFFCFLTNRSYFEEMLFAGSGRPYPVEYTYYTHRLFVVFAPGDFERYLRKRIPTPKVAHTSSPPGSVPPAAQAIVEEEAARAMLRWVLRHRSQLHVVDLQREIAALRDETGHVLTPPDAIVSSRRNLIDVTLQVAIELTLSEREVDRVLVDRPEFRRMVHDALYYPSRTWLTGADGLDLSPAGRTEFARYLERRTGREEERSPGGNGKPSGKQGELPSLSESDLDFLFDQVGGMADFLSDRPSIETPEPGGVPAHPQDFRKGRLSAWNDERKKVDLPPVEADLLDALLVGERSSVLVRTEWAGVYTFRHRIAGADRAAAEPGKVVADATEPTSQEATSPRDGWEAQAQFIEQFDELLRELEYGLSPPKSGSRVRQLTLDALATRFRIITLTPTWSIVRRAINRLRAAQARSGRMQGGKANALRKVGDRRRSGKPRAGPEAAMADEVFVVGRFHDVLRRNGPAVAKALVLGAVIGMLAAGDDRLQRTTIGMDVLARACKFGSKQEEDVATSLDAVWALVSSHVSGLGNGLEILGLSWPAKPGTLVASVLRGVGLVEHMEDVGDVDALAWKNVFRRLVAWVSTGEVPSPDLTELMAAAVRRGPTDLLEFDFAEITLRQWTVALLRGPSWLTYFAWHALGFRVDNESDLPWFQHRARVLAERAPQGESTQQLEETELLVRDRLILYGSKADTTLLWLCQGDSSISTRWRPTPGIAVLVQNPADLLEPEVPQLPMTSERVCAVEMGDDKNALLPGLSTIKHMLHDPWLVYVYATDRKRGMQTPNIVAPPDAHAVVEAGISGQLKIQEQQPAP